jgi:hypothetical protein
MEVILKNFKIMEAMVGQATAQLFLKQRFKMIH